MAKKKQPEIETETYALLPEEVEERRQQLLTAIEKKRGLKSSVKELTKSLKGLRLEIEETETRIEELTQVILRQQEQRPVQRQMKFADIAERRREEESILDFKRETGEFNLRKQELASADEAIATSEIDDAQAEEMYRAYDRMRKQMAALQEKALSPSDEDEARYIARMIEETRDGLAETERDWAAFVASNKERAEAIHRRVSGEHEAFDRERMEKMVKDIRANKKLSFAASCQDTFGKAISRLNLL